MQTPSSNAPVAPGELLASKYRVGEILGAGGMGVVVSATHIELEQRVALKFLLPAAAAQPELVERFVREARASVRLKSPHAAKTLDVGRLENGCPYIVMEFLEGRSLDAELQGLAAPLSVTDAAGYVLQACDALAEAHALGIVHRDLKPGNLFLSRGADGRAHVKVLDFGISKLLDDSAASSPALTQTSEIFGSPAYMSPEQMRSSKDVDERADIWAMGVVLFELVTGRIPFEASSAMELCLKVAQDEPPPPSGLRPDLPRAFERLILRCLAKHPADRFADVGELASALAPFAHPRDQAIAARIVDILAARRPQRPPTAAPREAVSARPDSEPSALSSWGATEPVLNPKKRESILLPVLGVALLLAAAGGAFLVFARGSGDKPKVNSGADAEPALVAAPTFAAASFSASAPIPAAAAATNPSETAGRRSTPPVRHAPSERPSPRPSAPSATTAPSIPPAVPSASDAGRFIMIRE